MKIKLYGSYICMCTEWFSTNTSVDTQANDTQSQTRNLLEQYFMKKIIIFLVNLEKLVEPAIDIGREFQI